MLAEPRAILHIAYIDMLLTHPLQYWIDNFERNSGVKPDEIVLPALNHCGPIFPGTRLGVPNYVSEQYHLKPLIEEIKRILPNAKIWCSINPTLAVLGSVKEVQVIDNHLEDLERNACITNPVTHAVIDNVIDGIVANGDVHGVVFHATDIYPQAASNRVKDQIQNTCFCNYCLDALKQEGYLDERRNFVERHIERLALRIDDDGVANIVVDLEPRDGTPASDWLYQNAVAQNFVTVDDENENKARSLEQTARQDATLYIEYLRARVRVTARQIKRLGKRARDHNLKTAVIIGDVKLDLTTMCDLRTVAQEGATDEVWTGATDEQIVDEVNIPVVKFLFARGTYIVDTFFERFFHAGHLIRRGENDPMTLRVYMKSISSKFIGGNYLSVPNVTALSFMSWLDGFIAVPIFTSDDVDRMIDNFLSLHGLDVGTSSGGDETARILEQLLRRTQGD